MNSNWSVAFVGLIVILSVSVILLILENRQIKKTTYLKKVYGGQTIVSLDNGNHWYISIDGGKGFVVIGSPDNELIFAMEMQKINDLMLSYYKKHGPIKLRNLSEEEIDRLQGVKK